MTPQEQIKQLTDKLVSNIVSIVEYPDNWLPHSVWVEEESPITGDPVYNQYMLEKINPDGTCNLFSPKTGALVHDDIFLSAINIDWLITIWNRYIELCIDQRIWKQRALRLLQKYTESDEKVAAEYIDKHWRHYSLDEDNIDSFKCYLQSQTKDNILPLSGSEGIYALIWNCHHLGRNVSYKELIKVWDNGPSRSKINEGDEELYEVERLTPDELAERLNDEAFAFTEDYVCFIKLGDHHSK